MGCWQKENYQIKGQVLEYKQTVQRRIILTWFEFFQRENTGQDGWTKKSSGCQSNGEKVYESKGKLKDVVFENS